MLLYNSLLLFLIVYGKQINYIHFHDYESRLLSNYFYIKTFFFLLIPVSIHLSSLRLCHFHTWQGCCPGKVMSHTSVSLFVCFHFVCKLYFLCNYLCIHTLYKKAGILQNCYCFFKSGKKNDKLKKKTTKENIWFYVKKLLFYIILLVPQLAEKYSFLQVF